MLARDAIFETGPEMSQDSLADLASGALGVNEAVGETTGGSAGACPDRPNEHDTNISTLASNVNHRGQYVVTTKARMAEYGWIPRVDYDS